MAKIALVDDDRNILTSLSLLLEAEGYEVECHRDGQAALDAFVRGAPDLAILDVRMPRMDGLELLQRLRGRGVLPVILLTTKGDEVDEVLGFRMGADDYVRKPFSSRLLLERIRALLRRGTEPAGASADDCDELVTRGALQMDPRRHEVTWKGMQVRLTVTEFLLLQTLAMHPGHVKSRDQLMDAAYADQVYVEDRTIDSHVKRLRRKFRTADANFAAIETIYGIGYRFGQP